VTGNQIALPEQPLRHCASCGRPRGNVRRGWSPITRDGAVVGWTCPECPEASEPIRRTVSATGVVRWRATLDAAPVGSPRRRQVTRTVTTLDEARQWVAQVRADVAAGRAVARPVVGETVAELAARWAASRVDIRTLSQQGYRSWLRPAVRRLGEVPVTELTRPMIQELVEHLNTEGVRPRTAGGSPRPMAPRSVRATLTALSQALDLAVADGLIERNPVRGVKLPRQVRKVGADLPHWTAAELLAFRTAADRDEWAGIWRLVLSGLTRSEVCGARWSDWSDDGVLTVRQARTALPSGTTATDAPKSAARRRHVPVEVIHPGSVALVRALRVAQSRARLAAGAAAWSADSGDLILVDDLGRPVRPEAVSDAFTRLCATAGVPRLHLHAVRHSLAFVLHEQSVTPADASRLLGHTVAVHLEVYLPESGSTGIASAATALGRGLASAL